MQGIWEYQSFVEVRSLGDGPLSRDAQMSLFGRYAWMELLHRYCLPEYNVDIVHARDGGSDGWLFLIDRGAQCRSALANWYSFAFAPMFNGAHDSRTHGRLMTSIAEQLARKVARINLYPVVADDGTLDVMLGGLRAAGWLAVAKPMGINHFIDLNGRGFAEYWAARPGPLRTLVRRKGRGAPFALTIHTNLTDALWQEYCDVYGKSWKEAEPHYPFLRALAEQEAQAGTLRMGVARKDGVAVAVQLWTVENGVALPHKMAHDAAFDTQSPGTLLSHHMFRAVIDEDRVSRIDYGTGNNAYKVDWMDKQRPLYRIDAYNPRFARAWLPAARSQISGLVARTLRR